MSDLGPYELLAGCDASCAASYNVGDHWCRPKPDGPVTDALSWGSCPACDERINIGDDIVHTTRGAWEHASHYGGST